ncbi:hypothetical protein D3C78_382800 [compost metagenome]
MVATYRANGILPRIITTTATQCTAGMSHLARDWSEVEKPPVEIADMAWLIASKGFMPASQKARAPRVVMPMYTSTIDLATMCERGMTFSERSEDSVWNRRMPPIRSSGRIATAMAIKPIPPSQCSSERHIRMPGDMLSRPLSTVAPVAVMPDMLSKKASV